MCEEKQKKEEIEGLLGIPIEHLHKCMVRIGTLTHNEQKGKTETIK